MARRRISNSYSATGFARGQMSTFYKFPPGTKEDIIDAAKKALKEGVDAVVADAQSRCPVRTGKLRDSIIADSNEDETVWYICANAFKEITNPKILNNENYKGNGRFYYGPIVEFSPKINKPFMYPALENHEKEIRMNIRKAVMAAIRKKYKVKRAA